MTTEKSKTTTFVSEESARIYFKGLSATDKKFFGFPLKINEFLEMVTIETPKIESIDDTPSEEISLDDIEGSIDDDSNDESDESDDDDDDSNDESDEFDGNEDSIDLAFAKKVIESIKAIDASIAADLKSLCEYATNYLVDSEQTLPPQAVKRWLARQGWNEQSVNPLSLQIEYDEHGVAKVVRNDGDSPNSERTNRIANLTVDNVAVTPEMLVKISELAVTPHQKLQKAIDEFHASQLVIDTRAKIQECFVVASKIAMEHSALLKFTCDSKTGELRMENTIPVRKNRSGKTRARGKTGKGYDKLNPVMLPNQRFVTQRGDFNIELVSNDSQFEVIVQRGEIGSKDAKRMESGLIPIGGKETPTSKLREMLGKLGYSGAFSMYKFFTRENGKPEQIYVGYQSPNDDAPMLTVSDEWLASIRPSATVE